MEGWEGVREECRGYEKRVRGGCGRVGVCEE